MSDRSATQVEYKMHTPFSRNKTISPIEDTLGEVVRMPLPGCCAGTLYFIPDGISEEEVKHVLKRNGLVSMTVLLGNVPKFAKRINAKVGVVRAETRQLIEKMELPTEVKKCHNSNGGSNASYTVCRETEFKSVCIAQVANKVYIVFGLYHTSKEVINHIKDGLEEGDILLAVASGNPIENGVMNIGEISKKFIEAGMPLKHCSKGSYGEYMLNLHCFKK